MVEKRLEQLLRDKIRFSTGERVMDVPQDGLTQRFGIERCSGQ